MRAAWLGLGLAALTALPAGPAAAACQCICVNGRLIPRCSSPIDPPAICNRICPLPVNPPGGPPAISGLPTAVGSEETLGTGSPALLGATGNSGLSGIPGR